MAYVLKGHALCLTGDLFNALEAIQTGLNFNLNNSELLRELSRVQEAMSQRDELSNLANAPAKQPRLLAPASSDDGKSTDCADVQLLQDDFCCPLCCKLLYKPVTTPCGERNLCTASTACFLTCVQRAGHTYCRECLMRSLDHANRCPMCRTVLHTRCDNLVAFVRFYVI